MAPFWCSTNNMIIDVKDKLRSYGGSNDDTGVGLSPLHEHKPPSEEEEERKQREISIMEIKRLQSKSRADELNVFKKELEFGASDIGRETFISEDL